MSVNNTEGCIFLIGFMACGKTAVGMRLAEKMNIPFVDTDEMIVQRKGMSINDIFTLHGEEYFRDLETRIVLELADTPRHAVCSVGGGLAVRKENRELMKKAGTVVYLRASTDTLLERLKGDKTRPLMAGCENDSQLRRRIEELMDRRGSIYQDAADILIDSESGNVEQVADLIRKKVTE